MEQQLTTYYDVKTMNYVCNIPQLNDNVLFDKYNIVGMVFQEIRWLFSMITADER